MPDLTEKYIAELRRLADEWETRRHDRIYVWLLRKRADELEGIAQLDAGKQAEREQLKAQPFTPQNFIEKMMAMDTEERQAFVDSFNSIDMSGTWRCSSCGKVLTGLTDGSWRWNGKAWEHSHGQAGHFEGIKESSSEQADR